MKKQLVKLYFAIVFVNKKRAEEIIKQLCNNLQNRFQCVIELPSVSFRNRSTLEISQCIVNTKNEFFSVSISNVSVSFKPLLFFTRGAVLSVYITAIDVNIASNKKSRPGTPLSQTIKYDPLLKLKKLLRVVKRRNRVFINVGKVAIRSNTDSAALPGQLIFKDIKIVKAQVYGYLATGESIDGYLFFLDHSKNKNSLSISARWQGDTKPALIVSPVAIKGDYPKIAFKSLEISVSQTGAIFGKWLVTIKANELLLNHCSFAGSDIKLKEFESAIPVVLLDNYFEIEQNAEIKLNSISCKLTAQISRTEDIGFFSISTEKIDVDEFLRSIPFDLLTAISVLPIKGNFKFYAVFQWKLSDPEFHSFDVKFDDAISVETKELAFLSTEMIWTRFLANRQSASAVNENGYAVHDYIDIEAVSAIVQNLFIATEDPRFFQHKGLDVGLFGVAISNNLKNGYFFRGGSTIGMQVMRNIFLMHRKDIARKLEEIFLTYLLEQKLQLDKNKILELYVNIIEFAPDIYGIKNAASFYFDKLPTELTLADAMILSYIIPRPKFFIDAVKTNSPQVHRNLKLHVDKYLKVLVKRGVITEKDRNTFDEVSTSRRLGTLYLK